MSAAPFLAALAIMAASLVGAIFASRTLGHWLHRHLTLLATFSAGVVAVLAYHLLRESLHESASLLLTAGGAAAGIIALELIHRLLPHEHHHHEMEHEHTHTPLDGRRVLFSDAIHNVTDGFIIVPAFLVDWTIGVAATFGIFLHELVQEISEYFILRQAGYAPGRALALNFLASSTILIGVGIAFSLASSGTVSALLSAVAAGGFIAVVLRDLMPHAIRSARASGSWTQHVLAFALGALLMTALNVALPHESAMPLSCADRGYCERA